MRSRVTFATTDAAAIESDRPSPLITALGATRSRMPLGMSRPSKSAVSGANASPASASVIARRDALRMSQASIARAQTLATETARALLTITSNIIARARAVSFFESFNPSIAADGSRITAAATTGPASGPRPASSTPATCSTPACQYSCSIRKSGWRGCSSSEKRRWEPEVVSVAVIVRYDIPRFSSVHFRFPQKDPVMLKQFGGDGRGLTLFFRVFSTGGSGGGEGTDDPPVKLEFPIRPKAG